MSGAHPSVFAAIHANRPAASAWSWRSTGDPGQFVIWHHDRSVASFTVLPGEITHRALFMDTLIDHLNKENTL